MQAFAGDGTRNGDVEAQGCALGNRQLNKTLERTKPAPTKAQLKLISQPSWQPFFTAGAATAVGGYAGDDYVDPSIEQRLRFELKFYQTYETALV